MNVDETKQAMFSLIEHKPGIKWDKRDLHIVDEIKSADTASELARLLADRFERLEGRFGEEFLSIVKGSLSPEVWEHQGVFVNPEYIPNYGFDRNIVIADGSVKTVQNRHVTVVYYGDVDLTVKNGMAYVHNTKHIVKAEGEGAVDADGYTQVYATGKSFLDLKGHARGVVQDKVTVQTFGHSFVESIGGRPDITAYAQSRFLISEGSAKIKMFDCSRGLLLSVNRYTTPSKVLVSGEGLLYVSPENRCDVIVNNNGNKSVILDGQKCHISPEEMRGLIFPEYIDRNMRIKEFIHEPMDVEKLKADIGPYLPSWKEAWHKEVFESADTEKEIALCMAPYIPEMVQKGLTGAFLRSHFTEETLLKHRIITEMDDFWHLDARLEKCEMGPLYFFGDLLVNTSICDAPVYGFEHTLVLSNDSCVSSHIDGSANAIVVGEGRLKAHGEGHVYAMDNAFVEGFGRAYMHVEGASKVTANGQVFVKAFDDSQLFGHGQAKVELYDNCVMTANDQCTVLALGDNQVTAKGQCTVAVPTYDTEHQAQVERMSDGAKLVELDHPDLVEWYRASMANDKDRRIALSAGVRHLPMAYH